MNQRSKVSLTSIRLAIDELTEAYEATQTDQECGMQHLGNALTHTVDAINALRQERKRHGQHCENGLCNASFSIKNCACGCGHCQIARAREQSSLLGEDLPEGEGGEHGF